jgi:FKBP-type peptidyl-prolyl cis-trans isomerase (trigger factor)
MSYTIEQLPHSQTKIIATIPAQTISAKVDATIAKLQNTVKIDGYRPGHVPKDILIKKVGELAIWTEATEECIPDVYLEALTAEKIPAIGRPQISITKIANESDAEIAIVVSVIPELTLPDYAELAKTAGSSALDLAVTDAEVTEAIDMLRKMKAQEAKAKLAGTDNAPALGDISDADLPELNDEFVKSLSPDFTSVDDFMTKLRANIEHEKTHKEEDRRRSALLESIVEATVCDIPELLVGYELDRMVHQMEYDLSMNGITLAQYLEHIKKSREELLADMKPDATKRAIMQLVLQKIAEAEKVVVPDSEIETELEKLSVQYASSPEFNKENARAYLETVMLNQAIIAKLEELGGFSKHTCA